jgi:hypothetical protein
MSTKPNAARLVAAQPAKSAPAPKAKPEVFVDQTFVAALLNAEGGVTEAAINLFVACTEHRVSPAQFVGYTAASAKGRASEFNCAKTAALLMGRPAAIKFIQSAANKPGDKRANVLAALRNVKATSAELKGSALKGQALAKEIGKRAEDAAQRAAEAHQTKREAARASRVPTAPKAGTVDHFVPQLLATLIDTRARMAKIEVKPAQLRKWQDLEAALGEATDIADSLVKA